MPKQVIRDAAGTFDVVVRWSHDSHVQVATAMRPSPGGSEGPKNLKELIASWPDEAPSPDDPNGATGLHSTLDRRQINELIRTLRRARDAAFGRDE
jgi:hypothetical protein